MTPTEADEPHDIDAHAAQWLTRALSEDVTGEDIAALTRWLEASPAHLEAYEQAEMAWEAAGGLTSADIATPQSQVADLSAHRARKTPLPSHRWLYTGGLAMAACAAAAAVFVMVAQRPAPAVWQTYETARGERRVIQLSDGSQLHLNSATRVRADLSGKARRFVLDSGEVAMAVVHDPSRPLTLTAGDALIRDIGTRFDVRRDGNDVTITVAEGQVAVAPVTASHAETQVGAGQQVRYTQGAVLPASTPADTGPAFAWEQGHAVYRNLPLSAVVADLNRYVETPLVVSAQTGQLRLTGVITLDSEDQIVRSLEAFLPVRAVKTSSGIELRERR